MRVDIIFDTICPWCFVGKRRLERALAQRPTVAAQIHWRPFLLNPDMPEQGIPRAAYLERKFGGAARVTRMLNSLAEAGKAESIDFCFDAIQVTPNSVDSHRLVQFAHRHGVANQAVEALFQAYFVHGRNIGDRDELLSITEHCDLSADEFERMLNSNEGRGEIYLDNAQTHRLSINGVPCFIFENAYGIAGAQDPDILVRMIDMAIEGPLTDPLSSLRPLGDLVGKSDHGTRQ